MLKRFWMMALLALATVAGCAPASSTENLPIPTLAVLPSPTPPSFTLDSAQRVAVLYLEAWQANDFRAMYDLISFASQEGTPFESFQNLYQTSQDVMTLDSLSYQANTLTREPGDQIVLNYSVTFKTNILGEFSDNNRNLRLIFDGRVNDWRVAWTPGDFFPEMGQGGRLQLQRIIPSRANIYDRDGNPLADQNSRMVVVSVIKGEIPAYDVCLSDLSTALNRPVADVQTILDARASDWLADLGVIEPLTYVNMHEQLERECGAQFRNFPTRRYPNGALASNIVGNVGYPDEAQIPDLIRNGFDQDSIIGKSGIEASWDETLRGKPGGRLEIVTPAGERLRVVVESTSKPGESVWLTLDSDLQAYAQSVISKAYDAAKEGWANTSRGAAAVMIDVNTGEILMMVTYPSVDANAFVPFPEMGRAAANALLTNYAADPRRPQLNRAAMGTYPSGSTMKPFVSIAVADSGVYDLDERYSCSGIWRRDIDRYDWLAGGHGTLTLPQAITQSCNPYYYEVGYQMYQYQPGLLPEYLLRMGFGTPTGLTDISEDPGVIATPEWLLTNYGYEWTFSEEVNQAIGQGFLAVTPLQMARGTAAIANGGKLYRPQLVRQVGLLGETLRDAGNPDMESNFSVRQDVLNVVREGMCAVPDTPSGTAEFVFRYNPDLQAIGVCGKTGTAQSPGADDQSHAWFIAYAPDDEPEVAIAVIVENSGQGSEVAAPIVRDILAYYFGVVPEGV
jgi:penicillin-binding protein 2